MQKYKVTVWQTRKKKQFHDWYLYNLKLTFFAHILQDI